MFKSTIVFVIPLFAITSCNNEASQKITTFILVRHAEKANDGTEDPDLNPEGVQRSKRLAMHLNETDIQAIYATEYKRTRNTVAPLASAKHLEIQLYEAHKEEEIVNMIEKHRGGTVVICGHSNNIPWTANLLTGKEQLKDYAETEYSILLIISVVEKGKVAKVVRMDW